MFLWARFNEYHALHKVKCVPYVDVTVCIFPYHAAALWWWLRIRCTLPKLALEQSNLPLCLGHLLFHTEITRCSAARAHAEVGLLNLRLRLKPP